MKKRFTILIAAIAAILMMAQPVKVKGQTKSTITITYSDEFTPALPTASGSVNSSSTAHTDVDFAFKEQGIYKGSSSDYIMFAQNKGFLYNTGDLGTIESVAVTYSSGTSTSGKAGVYFGNSEQSTYTTSNNATIKGQSKTDTWTNSTSGLGFFQFSTSNKNVQVTQIVITYTSGGGGGTPTCSAPQFTPAAGTYTESKSVTISSTTTGATIYYTTDGSTPTTSSSVYSTAIPVSSTTTIKAMAVKADHNNSSVSSATYTINITYSSLPFEWDSSSTPTGVTNNGVETYASSPYLKFNTQGDYIILPISGTPGVLYYDIKGNTLSGTYKFTVLESANGIDYTTLKEYISIGGSTTTETLTPASTTRFIKWIYTTKDGGNVALGNIKVYAQAATPQFSPVGGEFDEAQSVIITSATEGASIYYTLDDTPPSTSSTLYSGAIAVSSTTTINAIATKAKMADSEVATATYTIHTTDASISVSPTSVEAISAGVSGTLNVSYENIKTVVADVYYCDSNEEETLYDWIEVEIDDDNNAHYVVNPNKTASVRTAYFKVWAYADDGETEVYSDLVTVSQAAYVDPATQYILFSGELIEGDYLIVSDGGAMNTTENSNRLQYSEVTVVDNVIATSNSDIVWHIAKSGDYWTIYNANAKKYAASTGNKNQAQMLSDGTSDNAMWTVTGTDTYDFENKARAMSNSDPNNKWLRRNGNYGFACYAEATGGALSLYRKNDTLPVTLEDALTESFEIEKGAYSLLDNLIIPAEYVLTVFGTLEIVGTLTNTDASNLIIEDGGQLIVPNNATVAATFIKNVPETAGDKDGTVEVTGWTLISSPTYNVPNAGNPYENFDDVTNLEDDGGYLLYKYDEKERYWRSSQTTDQTYNTLNVAQGYLYGNSSGKAIEFTGNVNSAASYSIDLSYNEKDSDNLAGFNLIGNPFSHDIYKGVGGAINDSKLADGFYIIENGEAWTAKLGYDTPIKPGQGILVKATEVFKLTINNTTANATADKANHDNIMFKVENSECSDVAYALFDKGYGLNKISHRGDMVPMLYIPQNGENYAIAMMDDNTNSFNLGFEAKTTAKYTLTYKAKGEFNYLHVIDRMTGEDIDMLLEGEYSFVGSPQDDNNRFIVRLGYLPNYDDNGEDTFAYQNGSDIVVSGEGELQIFDVMGRKVASITINGVETVNIPTQGVYIMKLNEKTQKIVVR